MEFEVAFYNLLRTTGLAVYINTNPDTGTVYPCIIWSIPSGEAGWYVDGTIPSHRHARVQVEVWARDPLVANQWARKIEALIAGSGMIASPYGAFGSFHEPISNISYTRQQFGIRYTSPGE